MLSKSNFMSYLECPCRLWVKKVRPDLLPEAEDEALERRFAEGRLVDDMARLLHPRGFGVTGFVQDGWRNTQAALRAGHRTLFQPTAVAGQLHSRADILTKNARTGLWEIREVKMTGHVKEEHYSDVAFQRLCFKRAGVGIGRTRLVHLDTSYVRRGDVDPRGLFASEDITEEVEGIAPAVARQARQALDVLAWSRRPGHRHVEACVDPATCEYLGYYIQELPSALRKKMEELRRPEPRPNPPIISVDAAGIARELSRLEYPLHFLDYETNSPAIPRYDGYRPYQRVVFQYSLHVQERPGGRLKHHEFLWDKDADPTDALAESLGRQVARRGSVIVWNATFERGCNREMAARRPRHRRLFEGVNDRMYDLMLLFKPNRKLFLHSGFGGRWSIKVVLPALLPHLSYDSLAIHDGGAASAGWPTLIDPSVAKTAKKKLRADMLEYCGRDTFAMTALLDLLHERSA